MQPYITVKLKTGGLGFVSPSDFQRFFIVKRGVSQTSVTREDLDVFRGGGEALVERLGKNETKAQLVVWLKKFSDISAGKSELLKRLREKLKGNIVDENHVATILELGVYLQENGINIGDLIFFDEHDGNFKWGVS